MRSRVSAQPVRGALRDDLVELAFICRRSWRVVLGYGQRAGDEGYNKIPPIAGIFGIRSIEIAITDIIMLLNPLKIKLEAGLSNTLAIIIGIVNIKRLRPVESSVGYLLQ